MSGIAALFGFDGGPLDVERIDAMSTALRDHGPDARRIWVGQAGSRHVALAHRLMKITPEDAFDRQPVTGGGGHVVLAADARIDNRDQLAPQLDLAGRPAQLPDSAFILAAYEKWGQGCVRHLLGEFAFVLWDGRRQRLLAARDPIGARVLYYHRATRFLALASAPRGLFALADVPRRLDESKLADFLLFQGDPAATFYEGVRRIPPGCVLTATRECTDIRRYWSPDPHRRIELGSDAEYAEAFLELFDQSVRCRLRSVGPVAISLSGGIDSSAVAAVAARQLAGSDRALTAFTAVPRIGFDGPPMANRINDETPLVETLCRRYSNLHFQPVRAAGSPLEQLGDLYRDVEGTVRNVCNRPWTGEIRRRTRAAGGRVLLTGAGGNATFSYAGVSLLPELARSGCWVRLFREAGALAAARQRSLAEILQREVLRVVWPSRFGPRRSPGTRPAWAVHSPIRPDFARATGAVERLGPRCADFIPEADGRVERCKWMFEGLFHDGRDVENALRAATGVEARDPTFDQRLLEFCLAIPTDQYLRRGRDRRLARRALAELVPGEILENRKRGAQDPGWYERLDRAQVSAELDELERSEIARRAIDLPRLRRLVDDWPAAGWHTHSVNANYRFLLLRGLAAGGFARWVTEGDRTDVLPAAASGSRQEVSA